MNSETSQEHKQLIPLYEVKETTISLGLKPNHANFRRVARGLSMMRHVEEVDNHTFKVKSQWYDNVSYTVSLGETPSCQCEDWKRHASQNNGRVNFLCKHILASMLFEREEMERLNAQAEDWEKQFGQYHDLNNFIKW
jgi:hypothetical protein